MLADINRILLLDLRPWLLYKEPMVKFKMLLQELEEVNYSFQPIYEIERTKTKNKQQEYFATLIDNQGIQFVNQFNKELASIKDDREKVYLIHQTQKELITFAYNFQEVKNNAPLLGESTFVLNSIKHQLVRLYLEVDKEQTIDEVYQLLFEEDAPIPDVIGDAAPIKLEKPILQESEPIYREFTPYMEDFRDEVKGILAYETVIKNPKRFAEVEQDLFLQGYVDSNYNFTHKHGLKNELAMIYHKLIADNHFLARDFLKLKDIKPRDIRKFLDHRYNVNLDKQFRNFYR